MKHNTQHILFLIALWMLFFYNTATFAQKDTLRYSAEISSVVSGGENSPFWFQNNTYGTTSFQPNSMHLRAGLLKDFSHKNRYFDYALKADMIVNTDRMQTTFYFHEYYLKARLWVVDVTAGAREENYGTQDPELSSGGLLFSKNARPMPKITAGIENFTAVPFTKGYLEIKGALSHGWFTDNIYSTGVLLHHKYMYGRVGGRLPVHFQYGLDHVVQWGGYIPGWGQQPQGLTDYIKVFLGKHGGDDANLSDQINVLGNQIGSQSARLDVEINDFNIAAYWQNVFEDGPIRLLGFTMNAKDGLWGISIRNKKMPWVKAFVYEYLNTTDQSGPFHDSDGIVYGGNDNYFNGQYGFGWSYFGRILGTPFITSPVYNRNGELGALNSRVQVHHMGIEGDIYHYNYKMLCSFSKNYGRYVSPYSEVKTSTDFLLEVNRSFPQFGGVYIGCAFAFDRGSMYGNHAGAMITLKKQGNLFQW